MTIFALNLGYAGTQGFPCRRNQLVCDDTLAAVETANYIPSNYNVQPTDIFDVWYGTNSASYGEFTSTRNSSTGIITLAATTTPGDVTLPVVANDFANFDGTTGVIKDSGYSPTDPAKTKVVMANGAVVIGRIAVYTDTIGTIDDNAATATNGGNINAGLSGTAGAVSSFPGTASKGSLKLAAVANTNDDITTISNAAMGQATVMSIPDPGDATANFIVSKTTGTQHITVGSLEVDGGDLIAGISGAAGTVSSFPATAAKGSLKLAAVDNTGDTLTTISNAAMGQASVISIPDPGAATANFILSESSASSQTIATGLSITGGNNVQITGGGNFIAGASGAAGAIYSYPATASKGSLALVGVDNTGDTVTTISNAAMGQASTISIPDPGAATASFLLDAGSANIVTDYQEIVGIEGIIMESAGTWTITRLAQGDYATVKSQADETAIVGIDITPQLRAATDKGFRLASIDVMYIIATLALDAHSATLQSIAYANNVATAVTSAPLTGSLATATQANPYVTNLAVTTPAFLNTAVAKYVLELTVDAGATSDYSLMGINLHFSKTIS